MTELPDSTRWQLWIVAFGFFMQSLDTTIVNTALPSMAASLGESPLHMHMVIVSYVLTVAVMLPAAVLRGELEAIQDGVRQFTPDSVASLQAEVGTLTKLVDDLHQLSMSDEGALAYQKTSLDLIPLLEVASGAFRERFASRGLTIQLSLPDSMTVFGDRDRLMQLFNNLLENSLRYTDSGGGLHISAEQRERMVLLTFADSAPGVSDDQLQKLFERFYRTEGSRNRASGGSGLGLAICVNIVQAHNGLIRAAHSPFGGVSITVTLPLERDLQRDV